MKANHEAIVHRLKIVRGQVDGVISMVEDDRYCIDISTQLLAIEAAIKGVNREVLIAHLNSCLKEAAQSGNNDILDEKIQEMSSVIKTLLQ